MNNQLGATNRPLSITDEQNRRVELNYITDTYVRKTSAREHYYCWLSRFMAFLAMLSLMFFTSASLVLFKLAPEVHVEPFLIIKQDNSDEIIRYEAISTDMPSSRQMMELFIRQYVILRNTVIYDTKEMQTRWYAGGMVSYLSSIPVFNEFFKDGEQKLQQLYKDKISREVDIISVGKVGGEKSPLWKVDFKTYDLSPSNRNETTGEMVLVTRYWTVSMIASFIPERYFLSRRLMNPLGFTVTKYSQTEVEIL